MPSPTLDSEVRLLPASHWESLRRIGADYWWYVGRVRWSTSLIREWHAGTGFREPLHYADLGCGTGDFARAIAEAFPVERALLVDADPKFRDASSAGDRFERVMLDLTGPLALPFEPTLVTCMDVIEHLPDDRAFLTRVYERLRPGGLVVLSVPALQALYSEWDRALGHFRRYERGTVERLLESTGFRIVRATYMWSFLTPLGLYRLLKRARKEEAEFPSVPSWVNAALIALSGAEERLSRLVSLPFGTSVLVSAIKPR